MDDTTRLGAYLRAERERRGLALRMISENTKVSLPLLEGLEADDISRWPGGIFRRAFVRAYAEAVGLDPDDVFKRFEQQHRPATADGLPVEPASGTAEAAAVLEHSSRGRRTAALRGVSTSKRARLLGTAADLTVAMVLAFASAAAGSRLLWPVLMIAAYYAAGVLLTGTTPMVALFSLDTPAPKPSHTAATRDDADPLHA